jgi:hypothetical protein
VAVAQADQVLGVLGLALDAADALRDHEGLEALLAKPAQDFDGRDVDTVLKVNSAARTDVFYTSVIAWS